MKIFLNTSIIIISILFFLININYIQINEEFLLVMFSIIVFILLFLSFRRSLSFIGISNVEVFYFIFIFYITLHIMLVYEILKTYIYFPDEFILFQIYIVWQEITNILLRIFYFYIYIFRIRYLIKDSYRLFIEKDKNNLCF